MTLSVGFCHIPLQAETSIVPGAANIQTSAGLFATEIRVLNQGTVPANLTFSFLAADGQTTVAPVSQLVTPGQTVVLSDALAALWSLNPSELCLHIMLP